MRIDDTPSCPTEAAASETDALCSDEVRRSLLIHVTLSIMEQLDILPFR